MLTPELIAMIAAGGILFFGADKLPKLARSAGTARKEFLLAQQETRDLERRLKSE